MSKRSNDLVYGITEQSSLPKSLVILPRHVLEDLVAKHKALQCMTWGDVRRTCSKELFEELLGLAGFGTYEEYVAHLEVGRPVPGARELATQEYWDDAVEFPTDDTIFPGHSLPAVADGDWPTGRFILMWELLPEAVIDKYAYCYDTIFNGEACEFDPAKRDQIIAELERLGFTCVEDQALIDRTNP